MVPDHGRTFDRTWNSAVAASAEAVGDHRAEACRRPTTPRPGSCCASSSGRFAGPAAPWRVLHGHAIPPSAEPRPDATRSTRRVLVALPKIGEWDYHPAAWRAGADRACTAPARDHGFHAVPHRARRRPRPPRPARSCSTCPPSCADDFAYEAGQFCTFRVWIDGEPHLRCYSMSSTPGVDAELQVTVKRVPGGLVSNWMLDSPRTPATRSDVTLPAGVFQLTERADDVVAFAGGSGITPVHLPPQGRRWRPPGGPCGCSTPTATPTPRSSGPSSTRWLSQHPDRFRLEHHLDVDGGFVDGDAVRALRGNGLDGRRRVRLRARSVHGPRRGHAARRRGRCRPRSTSSGSPRPSPSPRSSPGRIPRRMPVGRRRQPGDDRARRPDRHASSTVPAPRSCRRPGRWGCRPRSRASREAAPPAWAGCSRAPSR